MVSPEGAVDQPNPELGLKAMVSLCLSCMLNDAEHM